MTDQPAPSEQPAATGQVSAGMVLDSSAILAYTQREHAIVELLGEVDTVIVPALALAEVFAILPVAVLEPAG